MTGAITRPRETGSALAAAGEITKAWLTDQDANLSDQIDTAIEKDAHNILSAMACLTSTGIDLHTERRVRTFGPFFELPVPKPSAEGLGCDLPIAIGCSRCRTGASMLPPAHATWQPFWQPRRYYQTLRDGTG
jgi:hypothetical protein